MQTVISRFLGLKCVRMHFGCKLLRVFSYARHFCSFDVCQISESKSDNPRLVAKGVFGHVHTRLTLRVTRYCSGRDFLGEMVYPIQI